MAVTILPARWRDALDSGELSIAAGEAAASLADLGPVHLDAVCGQLTGRTWQDPARVVAAYRETQRRRDNYREALDRAVATHPVVHSNEHPAPDKARRLGELFDPDGCRVHASEPCHAVVVKATSWGEGVEVFDVCVDPRRHDPQRIAAAKSESDLASDRTPSRPANHDDSHAKRKARLARLSHATETFAKTRGGFAQADLTRLALRSVVLEVGRDAVVFAATILGHDQPTQRTTKRSTAPIHRRCADPGAVALGLAENRMYWSASSGQCRYLDAGSYRLTPDEWTAATLTDRPDRD
jgi:hypothetical protein